MRRVPHSTWAAILGIVHLGLSVNVLVLIAALPLVALLITTDPTASWPLLALAAPLAAPALPAAFAVFHADRDGETRIIRTFWRAWRASAGKAMLLGAVAAAVVVIAVVDLRVLADSAASVVVVPLLCILTLLTAATVLVAFVALAEDPRAALRDVVKASLYLGVRRWYLTALSFVVLGVQVALFTQMPAVAMGITCAPALYVAWANARFTLRPVLAEVSG